jgi:hypothetical protein
MHKLRASIITLFMLAGLVAGALAQPDQPPRIGELSYLDREYMTQQRELMDDIVRLNFGRQFTGLKDNDLELLQMILDRRLVRPEQTRELQAMGVIMGDLLAAELKLDWVTYEDKLGRSRALRDGSSDNFLFPITMISRRVEAGSTTPVVDIYQKASDEIAATRPPKPYQ